MKYNNKIQKGINDVKKIKLSSGEKDVMFSRIDLYTKENPIKETRAQPNVWYNFFGQVGSVKGYRYVYSIVAALVFVFTGVGVTNAAEKSLPGDVLYPVKINVNEKVKSAVAFTPKAKAKVEEEKVIRRLDEVEALVKKGEFKNGKRDQLEKEVEKSVKVLNNKADRKGDEDGEVENDDSNDEDFENKLNTRFEKIKKVDNIVDKDEVEKFEKKFKERLLDRSNRAGKKDKDKNNRKDR